jgi:hypothetical protein
MKCQSLIQTYKSITVLIGFLFSNVGCLLYPKFGAPALHVLSKGNLLFTLKQTVVREVMYTVNII